MRKDSTREIEHAALLGGGVIGAGWAARLLINGIDVTVYDPSARVAERLDQVVDNALRAYQKMTPAPVARRGKLAFADSPAAAVAKAGFVQESGPERLEVKCALIKEVCDNAGADVVVASSSSGLLPSKLQDGVRFPERVMVGHPFNPVYLIPLVEIVGGQRTSDAARQRAADFYRSIGMHPLQVRKEIDAFIADRMMEALWREALHLVNDGVATTDEIDQAIIYGPGLRWAFMGSFLVYRVAGGEGGFRHFMEQFGPSLKWPWTRFDGPDLTDDLLDRLVEQSDAQAGDASIVELERLRDDCLVSVMQGLRAHDYAAGGVLKSYEEKLYAKARLHAEDGGLVKTAQDRPLCLHRDTVKPEWTDYNNLLSESRFLQVFGDATDALFRLIGVDGEYRAGGHSYYTVETHLDFFREAGVHQAFYITTQLLGGDDKRIHLYHAMYAGAPDDKENDTPLAAAEQLLLHVDTKKSRACPAQSNILAKLKPILTAHAKLPKPARAGRGIDGGSGGN